MNCHAQTSRRCIVKSFRVLFVPFLSFALVFSSGPVLAQNLVDTVPDFYYLEDLNDDSISVRACSFPTIEDRSSVKNLLDKGLDCAVVAEASKSDLENYLDSLLSKTQNLVDNVQPLNTLLSRLLGTASLVGVVTFFYGLFTDRSRMSLGGFLVLAPGLLALTYYIDQNNQIQTAHQSQLTFSQQVDSGVVGHVSERKLFLQQFTDFLNEYGRRPVSDEAAAAVVLN